MSFAEAVGPGALALAGADELPQEPDVPAKIGEVIAGRYRVDGLLASGGMGVVCLGEHVELEQPVAIKFLRPELCRNPTIVQRFLNEARAAAALRSQHVVRVMDVGQLPSGRPYLVMERLRGVDLDALVEEQGALPLERALDYVLQALEALSEAHAAGIIHRDIKPENLFLCEAASGGGPPVVKIVDFGLAKRTDAARAKVLTGPQDAMGSPCYMSPEQIASPASVDARTDIWSMGVVLYRLVTGVLPFDGESLEEVCSHVLHETPPPVSSLRRGLDADLDAIVRRCLEKSPARRHQSVEELRVALSRYGASRFGDTVPELSVPGPVERPGRRVAGVVAVSALVGLLGVGLQQASARGRLGVAAAWLRPSLASEPFVPPRAGSHAGPTPFFLHSLSGGWLPASPAVNGGVARSPRRALASEVSAQERPSVPGPLPEAPEPSFDDPARASILDGAFDVPEGDGKATSAPPGSLENQPLEVPAAVGEEAPLTPAEIERRKRAYRIYLERRGLTPLREVLGGSEDASETPAPR